MMLQSVIEDRKIKTPTKEQLSKWAHLTNINHHTHVRTLIALHFGDDARAHYFLQYEEDLENDICHSFEEQCIYNDVTTAMMVDIYRNFGKEVYEKVNNCL